MSEGIGGTADTLLPVISVIIVNWNGLSYLGTCLRSLGTLDYPAEKLEIILVDNNSSDCSVDYVKQQFPDVKILRLDANYGFCRPNNEGARQATGEYLALLNNDTEVTTSWLRELISTALTDPDVVCCASKMLYHDRRDIINAAGGKITIIGGGFYRGKGDKDSPKYGQPGYTGFACAAAALIKKDFFLTSGGFDEDYFAACEEHDISWKAWLFGHKVAYAPNAVMYHCESGTFGTRSNADAQKVFLNTRNHFYNIVKNFDAGNAWRAMLIGFCFNIYRWAGYLLYGNLAAAGAVCRAHFSFLRFLGKMLEKRKTVQKARRRSDAELYHLGVIATLKESVTEEMRLHKLGIV